MSRFDPSASVVRWRTWYSVSVFQSVGLTIALAGHRQHLAGDLRARDDGGIDLPAWPVAVRGLNSRQINHLQRYASETHYRGQRSPLQARRSNCLTVDEESAGQRLDNFLIRQLKGVPKTHVYRIIRSGEVRVNKGRAAAETRVAAGDVVRLPPVRMSDTVAEKLEQAGAGAGIPGPAGRRAPARHRQAGRRGGARRQRRELRRDRATAPGPAGCQASSNWCTGWTAKPPASCWWPRSARALTKLQDQFRERETGKTYLALVVGALAGQQEGGRRAAAQVPAGRRRAAGEGGGQGRSGRDARRSRWSRC